MHDAKFYLFRIIENKMFLVLAILFFNSILIIRCKSNTSSEQSVDSLQSEPVLSSAKPIVRVQLVNRGTFALLTTATGLIHAPSQSRLSFRIGGTIANTLISNGKTVTTGQILAQLDDKDQRLALRLAQDQMNESRVQLRALIAEYGGSDLDTSTLSPNTRAFVLTKSAYYKAQTALLIARQQLEYTTLRAPFSGIIVNMTAKSYNFITSYEPFCTLLSQQGLTVEFSILESELTTVQVGLPVQILPVSMPRRIYSGRVIEINPFVNSQGLVLVKALISKPDKLLFEGMNARVVIERRLLNQIVVPKLSVLERSGRKVIFTAENNRAKWNYVTTLYENDTKVTISEGLKPGDQVIVSGNLNLGHDAPIQIEK